MTTAVGLPRSEEWPGEKASTWELLAMAWCERGSVVMVAGAISMGRPHNGLALACVFAMFAATLARCKAVEFDSSLVYDLYTSSIYLSLSEKHKQRSDSQP